MIKNLKIKDAVQWTSGLGTLKGVITNIVLGMNAADQLVPWIDIMYETKTGRMSSVRLCANPGNLIMMKVKLV